jgi:hypothetical protein
MWAPADRPRHKSGGDQLIDRVAEPAKVFGQHVGTDRRVADAEGADHLLAELMLGERVPALTGTSRLPEIGLEETRGVGKEFAQTLPRNLALLDVPRRGDARMLPDTVVSESTS